MIFKFKLRQPKDEYTWHKYWALWPVKLETDSEVCKVAWLQTVWRRLNYSSSDFCGESYWWAYTDDPNIEGYSGLWEECIKKNETHSTAK